MTTISFRPRLRRLAVRVSSNRLITDIIPMRWLFPTALIAAIGAFATVAAIVVTGSDA